MSKNDTGLIALAGPDWLTITSVEGKSSESLALWGHDQIEKQEPQEEKKPWKAMGYKGVKAGPISVGVRGAEEAIAMFSGKEAAEAAGNIPVSNFRVTRFDLQVTVAIQPPFPGLAQKEYQAMRLLNEARRRPRYLKFLESPTGATLYVGKRTSAVMLRLYDKTEWFEKDKLGLYWRYEVEFKKTAAQRVYDRWCEAKDQFQFTIAQVTAEFSKRQLEPGFPSETKVMAVQSSASATTDEGRLSWLKKCVSPVVVQLCYNGHTDEVVKCLRLNNVISLKE